MRLLFGICGDIAKYRFAIESQLESFDEFGKKILVKNENDIGVAYPNSVSIHSRTLYLNGLPIMKDYTLDEFMSNPADILRKVLGKDISEVPREFVNGAYNGMIIDENDMYIFNDFMGLAPLYYSVRDGTLFFSTNLQLLSIILKPGWDKEALGEYLMYGYNFSCRTILRNISCLPPASLMKYDCTGVRIQNYASFPEHGEKIIPYHSAQAEICVAFGRAIRRLYSSKLKYSLSLTGGMDSRLIFLEWPRRETLLTETAGENSSDYFKAKALVRKLGNESLHVLEDLKEDLYTDGIRKYYDFCDNPTKLLDDYNYYHLMWKRDRGAHIHLCGVGGELLGGESLYLSRKPVHLLREGFLPYTYHSLDDSAKVNLLDRASYANYKKDTMQVVNRDYVTDDFEASSVVVRLLDNFLGNPRFQETYIERFRTFMLANAGFLPLSFTASSDFPVFPYNDRELICTISKFHPRIRELRRMEFQMLRNYQQISNIAVDTTHLKLHMPYVMHKFMRVLRFGFNIGFHKKIPFIQKGEAPKFRAFRYFDHSAQDYRDFVRATIFQCSFFDERLIKEYFRRIDMIDRTNFYTYHKEAVNISILLRLAIAEKKFGCK